MIYLVHYDRRKGRLVSLEPFSDRAAASHAKLQLEISLLTDKRGADEVVLLEALDEESLRTTHRRYFETLSEMKSEQPHHSGRGVVKYWFVSPVGKEWRVKAEGLPEAIYPTKEHAVAAAALDAKQWSTAFKKSTGIRIKSPSGAWYEEALFEV